MKKRIVRVRQHGSNDCGVACLASVAAHYGYRVPLATIHYLASTERTGTNVLGLTLAAEKLGLLAKGVRATLEALDTITLPAIAHVVVKNNHHYVVVYETTPRHVVYMDPDGGEVHRATREEFAALWDGVLIVLAPGERFRRGDESSSPLRRLWGLVRPHRAVMLQALVGAALYTLLGLSTAVFVQKLVDNVFPSGNQSLLNLLSVGMLVLLGVQVFLGVSQEMLLLGVGRRIDGQLIQGYYDHVLKLPLRFFTGRRVGDIVSRVGDAAKIRNLVSTVALRLVLNVLILVFSLSLMFVYSWRLALLLLGVLPFYALVYLLTDRVNRRNQREMMENAAELQSWMVESVEGIATVKHLRMEEYASLNTETRLVRLLRTIDRSARVSIGSHNASEFLSRAAVVVTLWAGGSMVLRQQITPGELLSLYALIAYLTGPVGALIAMNREFRDSEVAADRVFEVLDLPGEETEETRVDLPRERVGDLVFEDVFFRYGAGAPVLRGLSMVVPAGRVTAIVGESGSGKSTLVSLLHRCEPLDGGRIRVGEMDIAYVSTSSLRDRIGVVPQKVELFSGSIVGNLAVGEFEPDLWKVMELSNRLGITEFVEKLPYGFQSMVGENGATLSGGQRQRIAVARALYRDPEILILDEATSSLDTASERMIQHALDDFRDRGKTIVVIAHRLSTVMHADKIIVLHDGVVAEEGTHQKLLERRGAYHRLWKQQFPTGFDMVMSEPESPFPGFSFSNPVATEGAGAV
jgi:ABC-type bacteriocin transporter